jgi:hypothetical protein
MDDASRDIPIPSIEFPSYHLVTDGAMSPPVRTDEHVSTHKSHKRTNSVTEGRAPLAEPTRRQQTLTASSQTTKSGYHHHSSIQPIFESLLQKAHPGNKTHSSIRPSGQATKLSGYQPEQRDQDEASWKAAEAAQERQRLSAIKEHIASRNKRQRSEDMQIEQEAWNDRASATTKSSIAKPAKQATLSGAAAVFSQPSAPTKRKCNATRKPASDLSPFLADAKRARERKARALVVRNERTHAADDGTSDTEAQREAEANHALSKPLPYTSIRKNTIHRTNDDAKPQDFHGDGLVLEPSAQDYDDERQSMHINPPPGPFSLNSAAGIQAVSRTVPRPMNLPDDDMPTKTAAQRFMGTKEKTTFAKKASKGNPEPFPITAQDLQLYKWRAEKVLWAEVLQRWADLSGSASPREDTLRARFRQVEKLIDTEDITTEMCQAVIDGDKDAETELNRLAALHAPNNAGAGAGAGTGQSIPFRKIGKQEPAVRSVPGSVLPPAPPAPPAPAPALLALPAPRPTEGVKSFDHHTYAALLQNARNVYATMADEDEEEARATRQGSQPAEEDCVRWEYFMERRDLVSENLEDDYESLDSETPWREYNAAFDQVGHANAEAMIFIFTLPEGAPEIFKADEYFAMIHKRPSEGMVAVDLETERGMVQVRVSRRLLTFQDHLMPESKQGWLPKTTYCVQVRTKKKPKDDMFEEAEIELYTLDDATFPSLDHANSRAMEEWVRLTYTIRSINLNERQCKLEEAKRELMMAFEDEGGQAFVQSMDDDEKVVEVAVKALCTKGPRNV